MADKDKVPATWEEVFKHERFKALNARTKKAEADLTKAQTDLQDSQAQLAKAQTDLQDSQAQLAKATAGQTDLEKLQTDFASLQSKFEESQTSLEAERHQRLRLEVAAAKGIPADLATRLTGTTKEELETDADSILTFLKPATPGTPPVPPRRKPQSTITQEQLNDPKWVRENEDKIREAAARGELD